MKDKFSIDLSKFCINEFKDWIKEKGLLPSRKILENDLDSNIEKIKNLGVKNLDILLKNLSNKNKLEDFKKNTGFSEEYLKILKREINSYKSKPLNIDKMYDVNPKLVDALRQKGIKTNKDLFMICKKETDISKLSEEMNINENELHKLLSMANLTRINGIGPVFTYLLCDEGINNIEKLIQSNTKDLVNRINKRIDEIYQTNAKLSVDDIEYCKKFAEKFLD